jgi:hypothetical protein
VSGTLGGSTPPMLGHVLCFQHPKKHDGPLLQAAQFPVRPTGAMPVSPSSQKWLMSSVLLWLSRWRGQWQWRVGAWQELALVDHTTSVA